MTLFPMRPRPLPAALLAALLDALCAPAAHAQSAASTHARSASADAKPAAVLTAISISAARAPAPLASPAATTEGIDAAQIDETVNATGVEDALKYLPSLSVRKRFIGDTQAPLATRTTGINAGARSLVYADGTLLSALINNNNGNGSPQWFMVTPEEIARVDVFYGPYSAAYPGNSYGAVTQITTRMPTRFEAGASLKWSLQDFGQYRTDGHYRAQEAGAVIGDRAGAWSWWLSAGHLDSFSQPLTYLTVNRPSAAAAPGTPAVAGAIDGRNRSGAPIDIVGAGNLTHTVQDNLALRLAWQASPTLTARYALGIWQNDADASPQTYLSTASGAPYYGGAGSVALNGRAVSGATVANLFSQSRTEQEHWLQSLSLQSAGPGPWQWEATLSDMRYARDLTRTSTGAFPAVQAGGPGRIADASGTGWTTVDLVGRLGLPGSAHAWSGGFHRDEYRLANPVYASADWRGGAAGDGALFSDARGKTGTGALWLQDIWSVAPRLTATLGARAEAWRARDGFNLATGSGGVLRVDQPGLSRDGVSPKASLAWDAGGQWTLTGSVGRALRFPTVGELYQTVQTGTTFVQADPFLRPEDVLSAELAAERATRRGRLRLSVFAERVRDALISQTATVPGVALPVSFVQNVDRTLERGIELVAQRRDVLVRGLEFGGSVTYLDSRILADAGYAPTSPGATAVGKRVPYLPKWRATATATWRPDEHWALTLAGRASSRVFATVDNSDINTGTYQGFGSYVVADARAVYRVDRHWSAALGVDNLNDRRYFLFHPFPQRTVNAELRYAY